jgi:zinc/manganese transport system substrate-binding protein
MAKVKEDKRRRWGARSLMGAGAALLVVAAAAAGCGSGSSASTGSSSGKIQVAAAENFWGSIASQLGGNKVAVTSIITNPDTDPHTYQPTASDGRAIAAAQMVMYNGIGYDPWAPKLVAANSGSHPTVLNVGQLVGIPDGGNPHRWYSPDNVQSVISTITGDYKQVDPKDAAYFDSQNQAFETTGLGQYNQLISQIKSRYSGVPVGASESIFVPMAQALGLNLLTPDSFLTAISEGTEPTAQDKATIDSQIKNHQIKVYVYNSQNSTPDVQAQVKEAKAAGIPVTTITETLDPASSTFQAWQVRQLQGIANALGKATGQ